MQEPDYLKSCEQLGPLRGRKKWSHKASLPGSAVKGERALVWGAGMAYYKTENTPKMADHLEERRLGCLNGGLHLLLECSMKWNPAHSTGLWCGSG